MSKELKCKRCDKPMGVVHDASLRRGMVVYCAGCDAKIDIRKAVPRNADMPEFMRGLFGVKC